MQRELNSWHGQASLTCDLTFELTVRARSLEDIGGRSMALLGKGKGARILDKKQDSGMVVKLVEELRQAILIYQVCPAENHRRNWLG